MERNVYGSVSQSIAFEEMAINLINLHYSMLWLRQLHLLGVNG